MRRLLLAAAACFGLMGAAGALAGEGFVEANGVKFHYLEEGSGPPLVLIHGGSLSVKSWQWLIPEAAKKFHVYAYDSRGHGGTENPDGRFSYGLLANDAAALIAALKLDRPLVVGYSDGGITALMLAFKKPELMRAVVVGGATNKIAANPHYFEGLRTFYGSDTVSMISDAELDALATSHPQMVERYQQIHVREGNPTYWRDLLKQVWSTWTTPLTFSGEQLKAIKAPMLILLADKDEFFETRDAVALRDKVAGSELAIVPGATHAMFRDRAGVFNALVLDFLSRHAE